MAKLKINELQVTGTELFADAETFLNDLTDEELKGAVGGQLLYTTTIIGPISPILIPPYIPTIITIPYSPVIL